jgi:hypothetical protein
LSDGELSGSERVYRKLSYLLADDPDDDQSQPGKPPGPIPTRFVVDTITGASAGGINGIFLAKALVRGQQIDRLQELWVREGAIEKLLIKHQQSTSYGCLTTRMSCRKLAPSIQL